MEKEQLEEFKAKLEAIADVLYKGDTKTGIASMNMVIEDIAVLASWISDEELRQRLIDDALTPLLAAMSEEDGTLMADIITYELLEIVNEV